MKEGNANQREQWERAPTTEGRPQSAREPAHTGDEVVDKLLDLRGVECIVDRTLGVMRRLYPRSDRNRTEWASSVGTRIRCRTKPGREMVNWPTWSVGVAIGDHQRLHLFGIRSEGMAKTATIHPNTYQHQYDDCSDGPEGDV